MAAHFIYQHLPASGLGVRDPRRPYVTGGLGGGTPVYIDIILEWRIYEDAARNLTPSDRAFLVAGRDLVAANRHLATTGRSRERVDRIFASIDLALSRLDRSSATVDRTMQSRDRDLN